MNAPAVISHQAVCLEAAKRSMLEDDVSQITQRVPFIEVAPIRLFDAALLLELADASDRLAATVAKLQERTNAAG